MNGDSLTQEELAELRKLSEERRERLKERLHDKYIVVRSDGRDEPGQKHDGCEYFVLDLTHDPHALPTLQAYARSCQMEYPQLAADLYVLLTRLIERIRPARPDD